MAVLGNNITGEGLAGNKLMQSYFKVTKNFSLAFHTACLASRLFLLLCGVLGLWRGDRIFATVGLEDGGLERAS